MAKHNCVEPDFAAESVKFQKHAAEQGMCLDRLPGGFYVEQETQHAWASWIRRAAEDGYTELKRAAEACKDSLSLRYMESDGALYIRNDHGIVFDVHQNRSFPDILATNKAYADLVLAARPVAVLSLIAESEALRADLDGEMAQARDFNLEHEELKHERDQLKGSFKNFHRNLCKRFGYFHDDIDWQRDQVSLEEHIATQFNHVNAENAALRGQVQALQRGAGQQQEQIETLLEGMTRIMQSTRLGDPAFGIACEVVGELDCPTAKAVQP